MKYTLLFISLILFIGLAACSPKTISQTSNDSSTDLPPAPDFSGQLDTPQMDQQGGVVVEVTPLNLDIPGQTLDFQVTLNTHSVDLSMDLAALATLSTDNGNSVQAISWDGPKGGHHLLGKMAFPALSNGKGLLDGATKVTLTLKNVDAPERVFSWSLTR